MPTNIIRTLAPPFAGWFASVRSLRQRAVAFERVALVLEPHTDLLRAQVWDSVSNAGRDEIAVAFQSAVASGHALRWAEAEEHVVTMLRPHQSARN